MGNINYMQIIPQTREEKIEMYMKSCTKRQLAEMLANCNEILDRTYSSDYTSVYNTGNISSDTTFWDESTPYTLTTYGTKFNKPIPK